MKLFKIWFLYRFSLKNIFAKQINLLTHYAKGTKFSISAFIHIISSSLSPPSLGLLFIFPLRYFFVITHWYILIVWRWPPFVFSHFSSLLLRGSIIFFSSYPPFLLIYGAFTLFVLWFLTGRYTFPLSHRGIPYDLYYLLDSLAITTSFSFDFFSFNYLDVSVR